MPTLCNFLTLTWLLVVRWRTVVHTGGTCVLWSGRAVGIQDTGEKRKILKRSRSLLEIYDIF